MLAAVDYHGSVTQSNPKADRMLRRHTEWLQRSCHTKPKPCCTHLILTSNGPVMLGSSVRRFCFLFPVHQHVQLLTQVHLLSRCVKALHNESSITKTYLVSIHGLFIYRDNTRSLSRNNTNNRPATVTTPHHLVSNHDNTWSVPMTTPNHLVSTHDDTWSVTMTTPGQYP